MIHLAEARGPHANRLSHPYPEHATRGRRDLSSARDGEVEKKYESTRVRKYESADGWMEITVAGRVAAAGLSCLRFETKHPAIGVFPGRNLIRLANQSGRRRGPNRAG
jgi:hypothetical protein